VGGGNQRGVLLFIFGGIISPGLQAAAGVFAVLQYKAV